jgi:hypothetical protein
MIGAEKMIPEHLPGQSLKPLLRGLTVPWRKHIFGFTPALHLGFFIWPIQYEGSVTNSYSNPLSDGVSKNYASEAYLHSIELSLYCRHDQG